MQAGMRFFVIALTIASLISAVALGIIALAIFVLALARLI